MTPHEDTQPSPLEGTLSIQDAAVFYGVAEKTIRRRIKAKTLRAIQHPIAEGFEWRVYPESIQVTQDDETIVQSTQEGTHERPVSDATFLQTLEVIQQEYARVVEQLRGDNNALVNRNEQLAGQVGFLQAKVQDQERQIQLLMAPKDEGADTGDVVQHLSAVEAQAQEAATRAALAEAERDRLQAELLRRRPWWRRLLG